MRSLAMSLGVLLIGAVVCPHSFAADTAKLTLTTTETSLAKIHTGSPLARLSGRVRLVASPDNRHEAHPVARYGKGMVLALDGQAYGPTLQGFYDATITFSPDSKRLAYLAGAVRKGARRSVVVDGVEQKQYDDVALPLSFSPDSKRFAYLAKKGKLWLAVVDGVESKEYDEVVGPIAFSADGKRMAYSAKADGPSTGSGSPQAEPMGGKWFIVADGQEGDRYDIAVAPVFSPDGARLAFVAQAGSRSFVVLDGQRQKDYDDIAPTTLTFSPDGQHLCYAVKREKAWFFVADGVEGPQYEAVSYPVYSPDSARLAYYGARNGKVMVVVGGVEGKPYEQASWLTFSPDSRRVAYVAHFGEKRRLVVDGVEGPEYDRAMAPAFSPDSTHIAYLAGNKGKFSIVVDGVATKEYDGVFWGTAIVFDAPERLHTLLRVGDGLDAYIVDVQIGEE